MSDTPEAAARKNIDRQLEACGWTVQGRRQADITASFGVAVREFPLLGGEEADYLLFGDGKAIYEQVNKILDAGGLGDVDMHGSEAPDAESLKVSNYIPRGRSSGSHHTGNSTGSM